MRRRPSGWASRSSPARSLHTPPSSVLDRASRKRAAPTFRRRGRHSGRRDRDDDVRQGRPGRDGRAAHARGRPVPHDARQLGDERLDRDGREGRRDDGHRDPGRDHRVHARDGLADDHGRQDRRDDRPQARLRDRVRDLRLRLVHDLARAELARAALRLVVPGGGRRRADPAGDRRPRRRELPHRAPARRLWPRRRRGCGRGGGRAADRWLLHHVLLVALGLRGRGPDRARDPPPHPPDRGRAGREATEARLRRGGSVGARPRAARLRRASLERVGLDPAQARRARMGGPVTDGVARPRRAVRDLALLPLAGPRRVTRRRAARAAGHAAEQAAQRRARHVLLPVPRPGGALLRGAALPLGLSRPDGARDGGAIAAALRHAADRGDRDPAPAPGRLAPARRPQRPPRAACRNRRAARAARRRFGARGRLRADAADRARDRRARLPARRRHRLRGSRRREPRGRWRAEHDDEPRRVDGHGARGLGHDRGRLLGVPAEHPAEPGDPGPGEVTTRRSSSPAASPSSRMPTWRPPSTRRG